ncbi:MAG TPA: TonB-dependent receptor, partial [Brevundimonas sp.]|nr:TonB-dependent receptor [Brevundimonas sp.]
VDYFDIEIEDQVDSLGAGGILRACYLSDNFPTDPICNQFDRDPNLGITQVRDSFINVAKQNNRGLDFTVRYVQDTRWGELTIDSQTTWTLENQTAMFADNIENPLGEVGYPELVGNINLSFQRGPWTAFWGFDWIGKQDSFGEFLAGNGSPNLTIDGRTVAVKAHAEFTGFHSASLGYDFDNWKLIGGVANLFDEKPPAASTAIGEYSTVGNSVLASQYNEAYYGRRVFVRISKSF